jgi:hypothetical protein
MRAADRRWVAGLGALVVGALALRLWGGEHGLPFVYNADENAHFVPRAIGMFGHSYNPGYFINPPGFTYVLHTVFAVRWGGDEVQAVFARDPGAVFGLARATAAVFGVAFLPVHYSHLALNDIPTLAPMCLGLAGVAGVYRRGATLDYALAGLGIGLACAFKYTAGIAVLCLAAAALLGPVRLRPRAVVLAGGLFVLGFLVANPYALLDAGGFKAGLTQQASASSDGGGKLGLTGSSGIVYYLKTLGWGLGIVPALAALGAAAWLLARDRRTAAVLVPAPVVFLLFMGMQDRFFARWMLPVYPLICLLAAYGAIRAFQALPRVRRLAPVLAAAALCAQGLVWSVHNDLVLSRDDTRQLTRDWMVANVPEGSKVVVEPIAPDQWAMDPGRPSRRTGNGNRWIKWRTSRSKVNNDGTLRRGKGRIVKLEDYERTTRPQLVDSYARGGFCYVVTGSTQYGRAYAEPGQVPQAIAYYDELRRRGRVVFRTSPYDDGKGPVPFSFDASFNSAPLAYHRPGPEVVVYRLGGGKCGPPGST